MFSDTSEFNSQKKIIFSQNVSEKKTRINISNGFFIYIILLFYLANMVKVVNCSVCYSRYFVDSYHKCTPKDLIIYKIRIGREVLNECSRKMWEDRHKKTICLYKRKSQQSKFQYETYYEDEGDAKSEKFLYEKDGYEVELRKEQPPFDFGDWVDGLYELFFPDLNGGDMNDPRTIEVKKKDEFGVMKIICLTEKEKGLICCICKELRLI